MRMLIGAVFVTEIVGAGMPHGRPGGGRRCRIAVQRQVNTKTRTSGVVFWGANTDF